MTHSEAIKKLAEYGRRTYPVFVSYDTYKICVEIGDEKVGERLSGEKKIGDQTYSNTEVQQAIRQLNINLANKLKQYDT